MVMLLAGMSVVVVTVWLPGVPMALWGDPALLAVAFSGLERAALCCSRARVRARLRAQAERLRSFVDSREDVGLVDVGFSLTGRSVFEHRAVIVGSGREELVDGLSALAVGEPAAGCGFIFAEGMRACGEALGGYVDWVLEDVLRGVEGAPGLERVDVVQPVLFAVMVSLAGLWEACGVRPGVVVGHSQGEIAAACVAGGLSLEDAARVVALRSRALVGLAGKGGMVSVVSSVEELVGRLERWDGQIGVAAVNGPSSMVVSGEREALDEFLRVCGAEGLRAREIPVDYAAHSVQVQEIREELLEGCSGITPRRSDVPFFSTVTGGLLDTSELDGEYWYRNLRETVRFEQTTRALLEDGYRVFVEVSPHPVLTMGVQESVDEALKGSDDAVVVVGSLRRGEGGPERFSRSLSELWVRGVGVDWDVLFERSGARRVRLPTYAFQRERYWLNASLGGGDVTSIGQSSADHPLLGAAWWLGRWSSSGCSRGVFLFRATRGWPIMRCWVACCCRVPRSLIWLFVPVSVWGARLCRSSRWRPRCCSLSRTRSSCSSRSASVMSPVRAR